MSAGSGSSLTFPEGGYGSGAMIYGSGAMNTEVER